MPAVAITLSLFVGATSLSAQGLGDLARKAEEVKKAAKKGAKVYTNADAGNIQAATAVTPAERSGAAASTAGDTAQAAEKPAADAKTPQKDQAYWAERMKTLQTQLERDTLAAEAMQTRVNSLRSQLTLGDQGVSGSSFATVEQNKTRAEAELARLQKSVEEGKKKIADLEEEARRAGVPAGWLR
jgi:hypothetical protein